MMSILGRLIRRNILGKPMRSFAIIIALAASAFAMLFCIAGREAPEHAMRERLLNAYGGSEMLVIDSKGYNLILNESDYSAGTKIYRFTGIESQAKSQKGEYPITVAALDTKAGKQIGIFDEALDPGKGVIISEAFATKSGLKEGDTVTFTRTTQGDDGKDKVRTLSLKVAQVSNDKYLRRKTSAVIVNMDNFKALTGITGTGYKTAMVDLPDDEDVKKLASDLTKKYSDKEYIFNPVLTDDLMDEISKQTMVFYLIFAVVLLMTLFLTFSMSRHIANERLSTIGTLRSIGGSIPKTSTLLIIESAVYGLIGGLLGMVGFMLGGEFGRPVGFLILSVYLPCFGILDDMRFDLSDFPLTILDFPNPFHRLFGFSTGLVCAAVKLGPIQQAVFPQIRKGLCHFFQVKALGPPFIAGTFRLCNFSISGKYPDHRRPKHSPEQDSMMKTS